MPVLIPLKDRDDRPTGYFAALLDLGYFLKTYKEVSVNSGSRIVILNRAGFQLAELSGNTLSGSAGDAVRRRYAAFLAGPDLEGVIASTAPQDETKADDEGEDAIGALRKLEKYPLAVAVSRESASVFGQLSHAQRQYFYQSAMVSIAAILLTVGLTVLALRNHVLGDGAGIGGQQRCDFQHDSFGGRHAGRRRPQSRRIQHRVVDHVDTSRCSDQVVHA